MLTNLLLFAALVLLVIEFINAKAKVSLTTWAVALVTIALLLPFFRSL